MNGETGRKKYPFCSFFEIKEFDSAEAFKEIEENLSKYLIDEDQKSYC